MKNIWNYIKAKMYPWILKNKWEILNTFLLVVLYWFSKEQIINIWLLLLLIIYSCWHIGLIKIVKNKNKE